MLRRAPTKGAVASQAVFCVVGLEHYVMHVSESMICWIGDVIDGLVGIIQIRVAALDWVLGHDPAIVECISPGVIALDAHCFRVAWDDILFSSQGEVWTWPQEDVLRRRCSAKAAIAGNAVNRVYWQEHFGKQVDIEYGCSVQGKRDRLICIALV